jgi:hypothetical protein
MGEQIKCPFHVILSSLQRSCLAIPILSIGAPFTSMGVITVPFNDIPNLVFSDPISK